MNSSDALVVSSFSLGARGASHSSEAVDVVSARLAGVVVASSAGLVAFLHVL